MTSTPQPQGTSSSMVSPARPNSAPPSPAVRSVTPPLPPSRDIPKDFKSSLSAWWSTSSYKEARLAEERLLRRMASFEPSSTASLSPPSHSSTKSESKGWFFGGSSTSSSATATTAASKKELDDKLPVEEVGQIKDPLPLQNGLVATLKNVFIQTPNPNDAPQHPADPREITSASATSSLSDLSQTSINSSHGKIKKHCKKDKNQGKLVDYINTLEITSNENKDSKEAVVVLHGYAAALGFFFRNWDPVSHSAAETGRRTFFLDWLGMGLSSRPSPSLLHSNSNTPVPTRVSRAEHFFLSSLESWREKVGIEKMVLVGHSLGGYLASAYAVRYPERVSGLILVSPAGIPHGPEYVKYPLTSELSSKDKLPGSGSRPTQSPPETPQELDEATNAAEAEFNNAGQKPSASDANEAKGEAKDWAKQREQSLVRRSLMKVFVAGWERGVSPFSLLRGAGPLGPLWVGKYSSRRFAAQSEEDVKDLHSYIYGTSIMKGSGEYCISHILAPGAYARIPIVDRINRLKVPVTIMYGDNDWMDVEGGKASVEALKQAGNNNASCHVVPKAGHHLYLDNPDYTNNLLDQAIKAIPQAQVSP
ncbi:uncharacterized protein IL334_006409 [Kwoniella shivajii]|uniref:AB hydrolase-1 domain-containing protein n=1 Tax=Kwoniella shivajii TaxID=564305 RepID=A0ABZ1D677_9TREE|nr:hypothetical protein IL334_006409 [Kwoniella shivajii]